LQKNLLCAKKTKWEIKRGFSGIFHLARKLFKEAEMKKFNEEKTLSAILFLANQDGKIDLYALLKTIYYADKNHLHEWGRTITGDGYAKMDCGPVPSSAYDMLKSVRGDGSWKTDINLKKFFKFTDHITIKPLLPPDINKLSETDIEALQKSFNERGRKSFDELWREAHDDKAFQQSKNWIMTEEDLAEDDPLLIKYLTEVERNEQFLEAYRHLSSKDEEKLRTG
jgi:hypothetical protein